MTNSNDNIESVEQCLMSVPGLCLSVKSIAKRTGLLTKQVTYICHRSKKLRKVYPMEVGSLKTEMNTFTSI
uniref:Uncharacterized protein n=1 Tax=viral metagenome TaxID=1070528 RepID=A0A6C0LGV0_9ZZZZ